MRYKGHQWLQNNYRKSIYSYNNPACVFLKNMLDIVNLVPRSDSVLPWPREI